MEVSMRPSAAFALSLAVLLSACVQQPHRLPEQVRPLEFSSKSEPKRLVRCVALNARSFSSAYSADWSELVKPETYEAVVIRSYSPIYYYPPIVVAQASPAPGGSKLLLYVSSEFNAAEAEEWAERLRRGC
jgi:hypothetical protein